MIGKFKVKNIRNSKNRLCIFDKNNKKGGFIEFKPFEQKVILVNGKVNTAGFILRKTAKKLNFSILKLPVSQKNIQPFFDFDIKKTVSISTLGIDVKKKKVYFNPMFSRKLTKYELLFTIGHELGHIFFYDEPKADLFGQYFCLSKGVDPRFIDYSRILKTSFRVEKLKKNIKENE